MKNILLAVAIGGAAAMLSGCCSPAQQYVPVADIRAPPNPEMARIFVGGWKHPNTGWIPVIFDDNREIGTFAPALMGSYLCWERIPGRAVITADVNNGLRRSSLALDTQAGSIYWLWADYPRMKDQLELRVLPPSQRMIGPMQPPNYVQGVVGTRGGIGAGVAIPAQAVPGAPPAAVSSGGDGL